MHHAKDSRGGGDRNKSAKSQRDASGNYSVRNTRDGARIPVYSQDDYDYDEDIDTMHSFHDLYSRHRQPGGFPGDNDDSDSLKNYAPKGRTHAELKTSMDILREYYTCPICYDPCIEVTTTNCGHKFCRECLEEWKKQKPICPICSTMIRSQHRLYGDDLFIESNLHYLSDEVKTRFRQAQKKRLDTIDHDKKSMIKRFRRGLDNSLTYLKCKNSSSIGHKMRKVVSSVFGFESTSYQFFIGFVLGILAALIYNYVASDSIFMSYMWMALQNYDGKLPPAWMGNSNESYWGGNNQSDAEGSTAIEKLMNLFYVI